MKHYHVLNFHLVVKPVKNTTSISFKSYRIKRKEKESIRKIAFNNSV